MTEDDLVDLGLRFDLTVPLVRFFTSNRASLPRAFKAIQIGPVFRAERPQKGRYRQFTQCDIDIIGLEEGLAEAELLVASAEALIAVGFDGFTIRLNDRRILTAIAAASGVEESRYGSVFITLDKLDKIGVDGVKKELAQQGFTEAQIDRLASMLDGVEGISVEDFAKRLGDSLPAKVPGLMREILDAVGADSGNRYKVVFDPTLVRGMGYYTGPVFEIAQPGYDFSIAGGGRYDRMVGKLGRGGAGLRLLHRLRARRHHPDGQGLHPAKRGQADGAAGAGGDRPPPRALHLPDPPRRGPGAVAVPAG